MSADLAADINNLGNKESKMANRKNYQKATNKYSQKRNKRFSNTPRKMGRAGSGNFLDKFGILDFSEEELQGDEDHVISINELSVSSVISLRKKLLSKGEMNEEDVGSLQKRDLIYALLQAHLQENGVIHSAGSLELMPDGYGFLRSAENSYLPGTDDVYLPVKQIRNFNLRTGDTVYGQIRPPKEGERFFAMVRIISINGSEPEQSRSRVPFENLTPLYPAERINLETAEENQVSTRMMNLFCPVGKGQRGIILSPPRTGKTTVMQQVANSITTNYPDIYLMVLLIGERPEEVTDMQRSVSGEVIASTFDEQASRHIQVAEMVLEKARRLVESGKDVVILLDSITRLARAYNQSMPASGKILSGGVDSNALQKPKRFFGSARNIENGGSLTILATALIDTGSRMDEVIFEEFKGTGNMELVLDRRLAERRNFPSINLKRSGTRKEELLLQNDELKKMWILRNFLNPMEDIEATELIIDKMKRTRNNSTFLKAMNTM